MLKLFLSSLASLFTCKVSFAKASFAAIFGIALFAFSIISFTVLSPTPALAEDTSAAATATTTDDEDPSDFFTNAWGAYVGGVKQNVQALRDIATNAAATAKAAGQFVLDKVVEIGQGIIDWFTHTCPAASVYYQNHIQGCWSCTLFDTVFTAINSLASKVYERISDACITLLTLFMVLWLAVFTGRYIGSLSEQKPEEYITTVFQMLLKAMFIGVLLAAPASVFSNLVVSPVVVTSADLSVAIMKSYTAIDASTENNYGYDRDSYHFSGKKPATCTIEGGCEISVVECKDQDCKISDGDKVTFTPLACQLMGNEPAATETDFLNSQIYNSLMCMVQNLHYEAAYTMALGDAMMCYSWTANTIAFLHITYPDLQMLITGCLILIATFLISIIYVFKLIDAMFRLGVLMTLLPLLAIAWVFPSTVDFAKKGFSLLIHVMMTLISLSVVLAMVLMLVTTAFTDNSGETSLYQLFNDNSIYEMKNILDFSALSFITGIICLFFAYKLLGSIDHIASEFSGVEIGHSIGDKFASTITSCAAYAAKGAVSTARILGAHVAGGIGGRIHTAYQGTGFHNRAQSFNYRAKQRFGFTVAPQSTATLNDGERAAAAVAGNSYNRKQLNNQISAAKQIQALEKKMADNPAMTTAEKDVITKRINLLEKNNPGAIELARNTAKMRDAETVLRRADILEAVYGKKLSYMSVEEKEQLFLGHELEGGMKDNMDKVDKSNTESLVHVNARNFEQVSHQAELAEKVKDGKATEEEKAEAYEMARWNKDMQHLLIMQDVDFTANKESINKVAETVEQMREQNAKEYAEILSKQTDSIAQHIDMTLKITQKEINNLTAKINSPTTSTAEITIAREARDKLEKKQTMLQREYGAIPAEHKGKPEKTLSEISKEVKQRHELEQRMERLKARGWITMDEDKGKELETSADTLRATVNKFGAGASHILQ